MIRKLIMIIIAFSFIGCTHKLQIKNIDDYQNFGHSQFNQTTVIGIVTNATDFDHKMLIKGISENLTHYRSVVILPYNQLSTIPVDYKMYIDIRSDYKGSGWNYFIDFPGFLIWTPAWHGYVYKVKYNVSISLTDDTNNVMFSKFEMPFDFNVRHADIGRTWVECGWLEVGLLPFFGGFFHMKYDDDITSEITKELYYPIGRYIAEDIRDKIKAYKDLVCKTNSQIKNRKGIFSETGGVWLKKEDDPAYIRAIKKEKAKAAFRETGVWAEDDDS